MTKQLTEEQKEWIEDRKNFRGWRQQAPEEFSCCYSCWESDVISGMSYSRDRARASAHPTTEQQQEEQWNQQHALWLQDMAQFQEQVDQYKSPEVHETIGVMKVSFRRDFKGRWELIFTPNQAQEVLVKRGRLRSWVARKIVQKVLTFSEHLDAQDEDEIRASVTRRLTVRGFGFGSRKDAQWIPKRADLCSNIHGPHLPVPKFVPLDQMRQLAREICVILDDAVEWWMSPKGWGYQHAIARLRQAAKEQR